MAGMRMVTVVSPSGALAALAFLQLVLNSCVAVHRARARGDASSALFAAASFVLLCALLATVRAVEQAAADDERRGPLKAAAWALSTALTGIFAHRVAAVAPAPPFAVLVWSMAGATVAGGFYCLFVLGEGHRGDAGVVVGARQQDA